MVTNQFEYKMLLLNHHLDDLVSRIRTYVSLKKPSGRDLSSFVHWVWDEKPLSREESGFLEHKDDFVALSDGQEVGWLDGFVEDTMMKCIPKRLMKVRPGDEICGMSREPVSLTLIRCSSLPKSSIAKVMIKTST